MKNIIENIPFWLFAVVVFSLPFVNFPNLRNYGYSIQTTDLLFLLASLVWVIYLVLRKNKIRFSWFYLPLSLWFISLCLSTYFSEDFRKSFIKLFGSTYLIGLAVLGFNLTDDEEKFRKLGIVWLSATFLVCLVSLMSLGLFYIQRDNFILFSTLSHYGSLPAGNYPRVQSTFFNPNMLCNYLSISLIFLLLAFKLNWLRKSILLILSIFLATTIFLTVSPGIGGILLIIGLWFWLDLKTVKPLFTKILSLNLLSKIFLVGGILSAVFFFLTTLPSPTNFPSKIEPSPRVLTWISALENFRNNPVLGRGIGLEAALVEYKAPSHQQVLADAHQLWFSVAAQQGLVGVLAMLFLVIWLFRRSLPLNLAESNNSVIKTGLCLAFISAFLYQGLGGSFEDARHLWVLIGLLASSTEENITI